MTLAIIPCDLLMQYSSNGQQVCEGVREKLDALFAVYFLELFILYVCVGPRARMCAACMQMPLDASEGAGPPVNTVTGDCEPPKAGFGKQNSTRAASTLNR